MDPLKRQTTSRTTAKLLSAFELLRLMDREIPGQLVSAFLYIASHNPCHKQALEEDLGFGVASGSRTTDWLSSHHRLGKPGLGLIKKTMDPLNRRRVLLELTPKGEALIRQMKELIYD
jgi:DNA-binding MarR family transcriptional regulator